MAPLGLCLPARAEASPAIMVHRDPTCGCCGGWIEHLRRAGFSVAVVETRDLDTVRERLGVPAELASCHTAEVQGYVVEGHVPVAAIRRLLTERPQAAGLAVPGMPMGSPGMEGGTPETCAVVLFGPQGRLTFARYRGDSQIFPPASRSGPSASGGEGNPALRRPPPGPPRAELPRGAGAGRGAGATRCRRRNGSSWSCCRRRLRPGAAGEPRPPLKSERGWDSRSAGAKLMRR